MAKDKKAPELVTVQLGNGHATSAGYGSPGDVVALPPDEAAAMVQAGYAVRVAS
jgi:hypothetical protein